MNLNLHYGKEWGEQETWKNKNIKLFAWVFNLDTW
jgi:hypothetical protein